MTEGSTFLESGKRSEEEERTYRTFLRDFCLSLAPCTKEGRVNKSQIQSRRKLQKKRAESDSLKEAIKPES